MANELTDSLAFIRAERARRALEEKEKPQPAPPVEEVPLIPSESQMTPGRIAVGAGGGFEPDRPIKAVLTNPDGTEVESTAKDLATARNYDVELARKKAALVGGSLDSATLGFGEEIAAGIGAATGDKSYRDLRGEYRSAGKTAQEWDPAMNLYGRIGGALATTPLAARGLPGILPTASKPLLSLSNTARAAAGGGLVGLGESEADLTKGEVGGAVWDTLKGAGAGVAANTALGTLGKGYRYIKQAPERVLTRADNQLIDNATLGAPATERDALLGKMGRDREEVLGFIKSRPEFEAAIRTKDYKTAKSLIERAKAQGQAAREKGVAEIGKAHGDVEVTRGVEKLEKVRDKLLANPAPEAQEEAKKLDKYIQGFREKWVPPPPTPEPKGGELLKGLVENAKKYDVDRASHNADRFLSVAKKYKLSKDATNPATRLATLEEATNKLSKANDVLYEKSVSKSPIYVANLTGKLLDRADLMRREYGSGNFPRAVESFAKEISRTAALRKEDVINPRELRALISAQQEKAFSGQFTDPTEAKEAWRDVTKTMRDFLEEHVEKNAGKGAANLLRKNNEELSILIPFKSSAEEEIAASRLLPPVPPETRTGLAQVPELLAAIDKIDNPEAKRTMTGELFKQIGKDNAHAITKLDREAEILNRLEEPIESVGTRGATPPTTLRSRVKEWRERTAAGLIGGGIVAGAAGQSGTSAAMIGGALASKYGPEAVLAAEKGIAAMVVAARRGANVTQIARIGKIAGVPANIVKDAVADIAPRMAASGQKELLGESQEAPDNISKYKTMADMVKDVEGKKKQAK